MTSMIADKTRAGLMGPNHVRRLARVESIVKDPTAFTDVQPTLDLDFRNINGAPFVGNLNRATAGGYRQNSKGVYVPTVVNEPVIDFSAGTALGTGFYGAYTNLLLRSEEFDNAAWTKTNVTVTANSTVGPDGATTMDTLNATVADGGTGQASAMSAGSTVVYTFSIYLKQGTAAVTAIELVWYSGGTANATRVAVNWATMSIAVTGAAAAKDYKLEDCGGGIFRLSAIGSNSGGANTVVQGSLFPAASGTGTVYAWGAQLTATDTPVPYVPTTSATVARNADNMVISGTDFTDFFNPLQGTFYIEAYASRFASGYPRAIQIDDGTDNNRHVFFRDTASGLLVWQTIVGGVGQCSFASASILPGTLFRSAFSFAANNFNASFGGSIIAADTSGSLPSPTRILIGGPSGEHNEHIRRLIHWPKALTATELQRMTA